MSSSRCLPGAAGVGRAPSRRDAAYPQLAPIHESLDHVLPLQAEPDQPEPDQLGPDQPHPLHVFPVQILELQLEPDQLFPDHVLPLQELPLHDEPDHVLPFHLPPDQLLPDASSFAMAAASNGMPKMSCSPDRTTPSRVR